MDNVVGTANSILVASYYDAWGELQVWNMGNRDNRATIVRHADEGKREYEQEHPDNPLGEAVIYMRRSGQELL